MIFLFRGFLVVFFTPTIHVLVTARRLTDSWKVSGRNEDNVTPE